MQKKCIKKFRLNSERKNEIGNDKIKQEKFGSNPMKKRNQTSLSSPFVFGSVSESFGLTRTGNGTSNLYVQSFWQSKEREKIVSASSLNSQLEMFRQTFSKLNQFLSKILNSKVKRSFGCCFLLGKLKKIIERFYISVQEAKYECVTSLHCAKIIVKIYQAILTTSTFGKRFGIFSVSIPFKHHPHRHRQQKNYGMKRNT